MIKYRNIQAILPNDILKSGKNLYEKLHTKQTISKTVKAELFSWMCSRRKFQMNNFTIMRLKTL